MIIPIRCFTCGKILGSKYEAFKARVFEKKKDLNMDTNEMSVIDFNSDDLKKTPEGEVMDELGLTRYCCRKIMLGHIDLIKEIN